MKDTRTSARRCRVPLRGAGEHDHIRGTKGHGPIALGREKMKTVVRSTVIDDTGVRWLSGLQKHVQGP